MRVPVVFGISFEPDRIGHSAKATHERDNQKDHVQSRVHRRVHLGTLVHWFVTDKIVAKKNKSRQTATIENNRANKMS